jgi:PAS domain S-box-containing protein
VIAFWLTDERRRESEARLQVAVDLAKLGWYVWNPQTNELHCDETFRAIWGLPADAPVNYDGWRAQVHPDDIARVEAAIKTCVDPLGHSLCDIEYRVIGRNDGVERWVATRGRTNFKNGSPVSFYGVAHDITSRKRIESALEARVEARTRELEEVNRQLRFQIQQREDAEAAIQQLQRLDAIGQITSGLAHDFNNLLHVILINTPLLSRKAVDLDDREGVELIRAAAERGAKLTAQLLAFSRKQCLEPQPVDLNGKIVEMSDLLSVTTGRTTDLRAVLAPDLCPALVDPTQIELMVLNLAINARDAMRSNGTLTIETFNAVVADQPLRPEDPPPGNYVCLVVNDTGVGIAKDVLPRVFEPFFTTKAPGKGSGLGLSQVFGFAKQSGGGVSIETKVGEGTTVKVYLPRADLDAADNKAQLVDAEPVSQMEAKSTILVVDDDKAVLRSTLRMLDSFGFATIPAGSGREALRLIESYPDMDLVIADFAMPEMNGIELAKAIRATQAALPVLLVTGFGDQGVLDEFDETRILEKPYTESALLKKIRAALN